MEPTKFDDFTKTLAISPSRRQALQRIGSTLIAVLLVPLVPGRALADGSDCDGFCDQVFGEDTREARLCKDDAAHHKGLCYHCDAGEDGSKPICCPTNSAGICASYSTATCCGHHQNCVNGACFDRCHGRSWADLEFGCSGNDSCACFMTTEGVGFCAQPPVCSSPDILTCTSTGGCHMGYACVVTSCRTDAICIPACPPVERR